MQTLDSLALAQDSEASPIPIRTRVKPARGAGATPSALMLMTMAATLSNAAAQPAMHLSATGTGQVLIYPYYSTHGGLTTVFTVGNTTGEVKAVKLRLLEGVNSRPVFSANLYLAPFATFAAAIAPGVDDSQPAQILTQDRSCAVPAIPFWGFPTSVAGFTGPNQDWDTAGTPPARAALFASPLRTRDGHIEVIEMGVVRRESSFAQAAMLNASGVPANCSFLQIAWLPANSWASAPTADIQLPTGGLRGDAALVEAAAGLIYGYPATAIQHFYTDESAPGALHTTPATALPDLRAARSSATEVRVALPGASAAGSVVETFPAGLPRPDAVTTLLMASTVSAEASQEPGLGSETEWVFTMPTRRWYVDGAAAVAPFRNAFTPTGRSCITTEPMFVRRSGLRVRTSGIIGGIPGTEPYRFRSVMCTATTVIAARNVPRGAPLRILRAREGLTGFLLGDFPGWTQAGGVANVIDPPGPDTSPPITSLPPRLFDDFDRIAGSGFLRLALFDPDRALQAPSGRRYFGLPVIGLSFTRYINANAQPGVLANYSVATPASVEQSDRPTGTPWLEPFVPGGL
jgi:hypothetical protein